MTGSRPKALVTAAVSGPGLDLLHQLADLVLDSWLDQPSLRIYNATQSRIHVRVTHGFLRSLACLELADRTESGRRVGRLRQ